MKDLLSIVLIAVYAICIYRYSTFFLNHSHILVKTAPELSRIGILALGGVLFAVRSFIDKAFDGRLVVVLVLGGGLFFVL